MRRSILLYMLLFVLSLFNCFVRAESLKINHVTILNVHSAITPATYDYLNESFKALSADTLVVIRMNTPGGLVSTTKDIITMIGNQPRPVAVWINPEGASAASAGAIIASAAHFIFMTPGSNMGAATPVGLGEDLKESDGRKKAMNDLTALVRSLSELRGRPAAPFEDMIVNAKSYSDGEASKLKIIDGVVSNLSDLIKMVNGKSVSLQGVIKTIQVASDVPYAEKEATMGQKLLDVLANPSTAYIIFLLGIALIYFEFQAPGGYVAGATGFGLLILAAIAFQVLPLNWGALGLLMLGAFFLVMEIFVTSYGLLSVAGLASFVLGSLFLFKGDTGFISVQYSVILSTLAAVLVSVCLLVWYLYREQKKRPPVKDFFLPIGAQGTVVTQEGPYVMIKVRGEIWKSESLYQAQVGDKVEVVTVDADKLILKVKKI